MFGQHVPEDLLSGYVKRHENIHAERLAKDRALVTTLPDSFQEENPFVIATTRFGMLYEEAALRWFRELPERIRGSSTTSNPVETIGESGQQRD
jgi:hypothetical protein